MSIVRKHRNEDHEGCHLFKIVKKLRSMKKDLKKLTWKDGNIFDNVKRLRDHLKEVQSNIDKDLENNLLREEERDRNNAYFHKVLRSRCHKSRINQISDENGNFFYGKEVADQFVKHFQGFLGKSVQVKELDTIDSLFKTKLSHEDALFMIRDISNEEIKNAVFSIDSNKALDPNGFSSLFFKKAWNIVGNDMCRAIKDFFDNGRILREINSTIISLELLKGYERKDGPSRVAMKIDIQKAYDIVNWQFLEAILKGFGFHSKMVNWIIKCVTTNSFSICVNGKSCGYFQGGRGLRQGDPMSPYMFILVMEILTLLVEKRVDGSSDFKYHYGCKDMRLTHFCFADDLIMFSHRDKDSVMVLKKAIEEFGSISGLLPNYNKSTIIFGSMDEEEKQRILSSVPFKLEKLPVKYLGMPLTSKRLGVKNCQVLIYKIKDRVFNWKNKCLSYAGRLQLIASVLESIHVYWTSVFLLPQAVINEINKILKGFLWNQGESSKGKQRFPGGLFVLLKMK
ncbi:RNA-directed DNA polymerase, eukaryota, reverse transcriptase zinc-binding domain protein, partial [Tanacetum coccineum]